MWVVSIYTNYNLFVDIYNIFKAALATMLTKNIICFGNW